MLSRPVHKTEHYSTYLTIIIIVVSSSSRLGSCKYPHLHKHEQTTKIIGGEAALPGEFPYQVFIEKIWNSTRIYKCGGAVINEDFVITAAHCLFFREYGNQLAKPGKIWVTAGIHDLVSNDPEIRRFEQVTKAKALYPHPLFRFVPGGMGNNSTVQNQYPNYDIALIQLHKPFNLTERVQTIPLPKGGGEIPLIGNATMTGWGRENVTGRWIRQLRKADIPLVEWRKCSKAFRTVANVTEKMFCTGTKEGGLSPCYGDSGGPLACYSGNDGEKELCGIVSFGPKNCANYSVYTRVASYLSWIREIMMKEN